MTRRRVVLLAVVGLVLAAAIVAAAALAAFLAPWRLAFHVVYPSRRKRRRLVEIEALTALVSSAFALARTARRRDTGTPFQLAARERRELERLRRMFDNAYGEVPY